MRLLVQINRKTACRVALRDTICRAARGSGAALHAQHPDYHHPDRMFPYTLNLVRGVGSRDTSEQAPSMYASPVAQRPDLTVRKTGYDLLHDPCNNLPAPALPPTCHGLSLSPAECEWLRLRGLLPPTHLDIDLQRQRFLEEYLCPREMMPTREDGRLGGGH